MLSLSMIVRDEAERLGSCLASVAGFVDELVVVDTGSQDDSVEIARRHGATVHQIAWPGDFAPARNLALESVSGDWVLVLDADEQLLPEARAPLRALMALPDVLLINLLRLERGAEQSPYSSVSRLFRRHPAIHWSRPYHAMVDDSVAALIAREPGWRVAECPLPALVHDGYRPELLAAGDKAERLRLAMEQDLRDNPSDPYASAKLGGLEISEGRHRQAISRLEAGLAHCPEQAHPQRYELLFHLAIATAALDSERAIDLYRQALAIPLNPRLSLGAQLNLAALLLRQGNAQAALALAETATRRAPEVALGWGNLGLIRRRLGDIAGAIEAYGQSLRLNPSQAETHQNLAAAQLLGGNIDGARSHFSQAIRLLRRQGRALDADQLLRQAGAMVRLDA
ncbi:glycosyltransferase [Synechococcus sp. CS-1324]|uniref:glycosyltransferase n=1 Tax=unclassified Synechococcus TaxID=2626047 RepID=UPI000DAF9A88|nr:MULTISPECIES: glycosyltransferase [unclassified Synechococcus]MCT0212180.1 glycosyltransferase [Synechococcus sp. CS-1326]MCT0230445.1 glycosyltransferase [Synechococcus sp. CS-1324]MCT0233377.1 glycosyltransferase [Synechococcus sp. CS-1327]PZV03310.1 MAG: glycosyl transferase [Cyanobium sp.]